MIEGFFAANEARLLRRYAKNARGAIVEIGSYKGLTTSILAQGARESGQLVYAIDPHNAYDDPHPGGASFGPADNIEFLRNIAPFGDVVRVINLPAEQVVQCWNWREKIDLLFIDGSHLFADVMRDFYLWSVFVDGHILLHDTTTIADVRDFLQHIFNAGKWQLVERADSTAVLKQC